MKLNFKFKKYVGQKMRFSRAHTIQSVAFLSIVIDDLLFLHSMPQTFIWLSRISRREKFFTFKHEICSCRKKFFFLRNLILIKRKTREKSSLLIKRLQMSQPRHSLNFFYLSTFWTSLSNHKSGRDEMLEVRQVEEISIHTFCCPIVVSYKISP